LLGERLPADKRVGLDPRPAFAYRLNLEKNEAWQIVDAIGLPNERCNHGLSFRGTKKGDFLDQSSCNTHFYFTRLILMLCALLRLINGDLQKNA